MKSMADAMVSRQLTFDKKTIQGIAWAEDDRRLLFSSNRDGAFQLWSIAVDGGKPAIVRTNSSSAAEPAMDRSGDWIVYVQSNVNWNIWRWPLNGSSHDAPQRLISSSGRNYDARYSPDGSRIAFVSDRSGSMELWIANSEGEDAKQLTHLGSTWLGGVNWSPDGRQIVFDARPQDHSAIFVISPAGGGSRLLDANSYEERMPCWSPDGQFLYFNSNRSGTLAIWRRSLADGFHAAYIAGRSLCRIGDTRGYCLQQPGRRALA